MSAITHMANPNALPRLETQGLEPEVAAVFGAQAHDAARREITAWPGYRPTPLVPLPAMAAEIGVGAVFYKDEAYRFDLSSFKALGGAYAVLRVLQRVLSEGGSTPSRDEIKGRAGHITVCCATDGNHGRSVAWGASIFGCACKIYLHENVSMDREAAIAAFGAEIVRCPGNYDASVRACAQDAQANGWYLVADTDSGGGPADIAQLVMQGYTVLAREVFDALDAPATHIFIPAGVGGLVAAIAGTAARLFGSERPRIVCVEPDAADCVFRALGAGEPIALTGDVESFMACLSAGEVSPAAWPVLRALVDDALTIPDEAAAQMMRRLAKGTGGDPPIVSGESGAAAPAALLAAASDPAVRQALQLDATSRVVVIGTEGATAPDIYAAVTGRRPEAVLA